MNQKLLNNNPKVRISEPLFHTVTRFMDATKQPHGFANGLDEYIKHLNDQAKGAYDAQKTSKEGVCVV